MNSRDLTRIYGAAGGAMAAVSGGFFADYMAERVGVVSEHLSRAPELTESAYKAAFFAAENATKFDGFLGVISGSLAGLLMTSALIEARK